MEHNSEPSLTHLTGLTPTQRKARAQQLIHLLESKTDATHPDGQLSLAKALIVLDMLEATCPGCGRSVGAMFDVGLPDPDDPPRLIAHLHHPAAQPAGGAAAPASPASATAPVAAHVELVAKTPTSPNKGSYLHNLWHLIAG